MVEQPGLELRDVSFRIGAFAINGLSFAVRQGEYFVLTGPNGAGKTITARLIAGLARPIEGDVFIRGNVATDLAPWERNVGYMPQDGVLFPNRTVERNIGFGLEVRGAGRATVRRRVEAVANLLKIGHLLPRMPQGLSGGERQKVNLARALAFDPAVLLLDEPLSAIDEDTRDELCRELRRIHEQMGITTLHVAHNRRETELVADRVGVMAGGRLQGVEA
ncbi:MAG: ABC transporter ATP-binding protein [Kiritimatiellae bacterium]|nr:ABC transporter ATP-binding protein [Kiritimatiellia bacterium]